VLAAGVRPVPGRGVVLGPGTSGQRQARRPPSSRYLVGANDAAHVFMSRSLRTKTVKLGSLFWHGSGGELRYLEVTRDEWTGWDGIEPLNWQGQALLNYAKSINP
jgi:hypothetical protein